MMEWAATRWSSAPGLWRVGGSRNVSRWTAWAALACTCLLGPVGCKGLAEKATPYESRLTLVDGGEVTVVMGQLGTRPGQLLTAAESLDVNVYFDPKLVRLDKVASYTLWGRLHRSTSGKRESWQKLGTAALGEAVPSVGLDEGLVGLRASVTYETGEQELLPRRTYEPALWLIVDRSPPRLSWVEPAQSTSLINLRNVRLEWHAVETRFGDAPYRLTWSGDDGATWRTIASVPASPGKQRYRWWLPSDAVGNLLVRVEAEDFAGHRSAAVLPLIYYPKPQPDAERDVEPSPAELELTRPVDSEQEPGAAFAAESRGTGHSAENHGRGESTSGGAKHAAGVEGQAGPALAEWLPENVPDNLPENLRHLVREQGDGDAAEAASDEATANVAPAIAGAAADASATESAEGTPRPSALRGAPADATVEAAHRQPYPQLALGTVPAVCGRTGLVIPYTLHDPGGLGVEEIQSYVRLRGEHGWSLLPSERLVVDARNITLELPGFSAGEYEFFFRPVDRAGDAAPPPGPRAQPHGRFRLDLTPPRLTARGSSLDWVGGFEAQARVDTDWDEVAGPLLIEGGRDDGSWEPISQWEKPAPGQPIRFPLPVGSVEYKVRFSVEDRAGNRGSIVLGPRQVASSIRFATFVNEDEYPSGGVAQVKWTLHPVAAAEQESLEVGIWHQSQEGGAWALLDRVPPTVRFLWDLPAVEAAGAKHRLRLRLFRGSAVVGEAFSAPFRLRGPSTPVMSISSDSRFYAKQARTQLERYDAALADRSRGIENPQELASFARSVQSAFRKALQADPRNFEAAYGLAKFLNRVDPRAHAAEIRQLLQQVTEVHPAHFWALNDLGALYIQDEDFARAEEVLSRAVELKPRAIAFYNLGLAIFYQRRMAEARRHFDQALRGEEREQVAVGEIYYYVIHSYLQEGDVDSARRVFGEHGGAIPAELREDLSASL